MSSAFRGDSVAAVVGWKWLSQHTFSSSSFFKLPYEIKGGTSTFSPQILSLRGFFFFFFSRAPLMTSEHDKWSWCDGMCGKPKWLWGSELPKPTQRARHSNLRLRRWRERERGGGGSKVVSFQAWYENLHRFYLSLLVEVPSEAWIFCKTLLTTTGRGSELKTQQQRETWDSESP